MCNICKNKEAKYSMSGINYKMCSQCHNNILKIRQGVGYEAKKYFDSIIESGTSDEAKAFIISQYNEYNIENQKEQNENTTKKITQEDESFDYINHTSFVWPEKFLITVIILDILSLIGALYISIKVESFILLIAITIEIVLITTLAFSIKEIAEHIEKIENNIKK